jgi:hypothetical protein
MIAIMSEIGAIGKNQQNQQQRFNYRGIDDVYNALHTLMAKHKVFNTPEVLEVNREQRTNAKGTILAFVTMRVKYTFHAEDGSTVECVVTGEGMDSGDKASNKALAIAHKYAILQVFCVPTQEIKDPDAESHVTIDALSSGQVADIRENLEEVGMKEADMLAAGNFTCALEQVPASQYEGIIDYIRGSK